VLCCVCLSSAQELSDAIGCPGDVVSNAAYCPAGGVTPVTSGQARACGYIYVIPGSTEPTPEPQPTPPEDCTTTYSTPIGQCFDIPLYTSLAYGTAAASEGTLSLDSNSAAVVNGTMAVTNVVATGNQITGTVETNSTSTRTIVCVACMNCNPLNNTTTPTPADNNTCMYTVIALEHNCRHTLVMNVVDQSGNTMTLTYSYQPNGRWYIDDPTSYPWAPFILATICIDDSANYIVVSTCYTQAVGTAQQQIFAFSDKPSSTSGTTCCDDDTNFENIQQCVTDNFGPGLTPQAAGPTFEECCHA